MATRSTTGTQQPVPNARIDLYLQGATVTTGVSIATTATVSVDDAGALYETALVQAGAGGPILTVNVVVTSTQVTLQNTVGATITIAPGTRLILLSARPTAYSDPFATAAPSGSTVTADSGGRATVFLPEGSYDYLVTDPSDPAITLDSSTTNSIASGTATLTLLHTISSGQTLLLVAIAWQESTDTETLDSVTCDGAPMTHLGSAPMVDYYGLLHPATGSRSITATWSGTSTKAAIGEAIGVTVLDPISLPSATRCGSGTGTTPAVTAAGATPKSLILAALAANTVPGTVTVSVGTGVTSLWNAGAGSAPSFTRTQTNGGSIPTGTSPTGIGWSMTASRAWGIVALEIAPWLTLVTNVAAVACPANQYGILATAYSGLQAAIDALPAIGGVIYVPSGTYRLTSGLVIAKPNVTLIGEGASTVITPLDPVHNPLDLLTITRAEVRLYRLKFDGGETATDFTTGHCGIICLGQDATDPQNLVQHCYFENVVVVGTSRYGLWLQDTILLTAVNCEFVLNKGDGVRIQAAEDGGVSAGLRFIGCAMSGNGGVGVNIGNPDDSNTGQASQTFLGCTMEENEGASIGEDMSVVGVSVTAVNAVKLEFIGCYFEHPTDEAVQFMYFGTCPNVTVDNCIFFGNTESFESGPAFAVYFANCIFARLSSNTMQGFSTGIAAFDSDCADCVEMCNRELDDTGVNVPRISISGIGVIGMSRSAVGLRGVADETALPDQKSVGTLVWVDTPTGAHSHLQIWTSTGWKSITLT